MTGDKKAVQLHRPDTKERIHYTGQRRGTFRIHPRLLYAGRLNHSGFWNESQHSHNFCEILFVTDGKGIINAAGTDYIAEKGDIIIYNPGEMHHERSLPEIPLQMSFIAVNRFRLGNLPPNTLPTCKTGVLLKSGEHAADFEMLFKSLICELQSTRPFSGEITESITQTILFYVLRIIQQKEKDGLPQCGSSILKQALGYIENNFHEPITLETIAAKCFVNKYYLAHLFKNSLGVSIGRYIRTLRINKAKKLLSETDKTLAEISAECGFSEINYFYRTFKKETSLTPTSFRKSFRSI